MFFINPASVEKSEGGILLCSFKASNWNRPRGGGLAI